VIKIRQRPTAALDVAIRVSWEHHAALDVANGHTMALAHSLEMIH
jgi:hypothetical protein